MSNDIAKRLHAWAKDAATGRNIMGCDQDLRLAADTIASLRKQLEDARSEALEEALTAVVGTNADGDRSALSAYQKCIYAIRALKGKS